MAKVKIVSVIVENVFMCVECGTMKMVEKEHETCCSKPMEKAGWSESTNDCE